jgi:hypothetical protein
MKRSRTGHLTFRVQCSFLSLSPEAVANRNVEFGTLDLKPVRRLTRHGLVIVVSVIIMKLAQKGEEYVTTRKV